MKRKVISFIVVLCMLLMIVPMEIVAENDQNIQYYYGDANIDGKVNTADATLVLKYSSSIVIFEPGTLQYTLADANRDEFINTADASFILRYCAGMGTIYPYYSSVTITYVAGDVPQDADVFVPRSVEVDPGTVYTVASGATYEGHIFLCWQSDYDNQVYQPGQTFVVPEKNVTLTAIWQTGDEPTPTTQPTETPTTEPTPIEGSAKISVHYYDCFNEIDVGTFEQYVSGDITQLTGDVLDIPTGYKLDDTSYSASISVLNGVATPSSFNVNVYPCQTIEDKLFKVIYTNVGFMKVQNDLSQNYILGANIELTTQMMPFGWNWQNTQQPDTEFTGIFDGNGYSISGLWIDETMEIIYDDGSNVEYSANADIGLFAVNAGIIRNLTVITRLWSGISGAEDYGVYGDIDVGVVCGINSGTVSNCHAFGNSGTLCYLTPDTGDLPNAGGLVGKNTSSGVIEYSSYEGGVEGFELCGGIAGINYGTIRECYFAGGINWGDDMTDDLLDEFEVTSVGGICGAGVKGTVSDCYVYLTQKLKAAAAVGGIAGMDAGSTYRNCIVQNAQNIYMLVDAGTGDTYVGYKNSSYPTTESGMYSNVSSLPSGFSTSIWDMQGACYSATPDLINNRRGSSFYPVQG